MMRNFILGAVIQYLSRAINDWYLSCKYCSNSLPCRNVKPIDAVPRPKGLGLGADRSAALQAKGVKESAKGDKNEEDLTLKKGAFCMVTSGKHKDLYAEVSYLERFKMDILFGLIESMFTHACPQKPLRNKLTTHYICGLISDLVICKHREEYGHTWHWMSLLRPSVLKAPSRQPAVCYCVVVTAAYTNRGGRPGLPNCGFKQDRLTLTWNI